MSKNMRIVCAGVVCGILASAMTAMSAMSERHDFTNNVSGVAIANGWEGWSVVNQSGGTSVFYTATSHVYGATTTGLVAKLRDSTVGHSFTTLDQQSNVFVWVRISPVLNDTEPTATEVTNAAAVFWFGSDSNVYYYSNNTLKSSSFGNVVTNGAWYDVTAHLNYNTKQYDLFVNSPDDATRSVMNIGFYTQNAVAFSNLTVLEKSTETASLVDFIDASTQSNSPSATTITILAYMTVDGVVVKFETTKETAANGTVMSVYRKLADGSRILVGTVKSQGPGEGPFTYQLIDSQATAAGTYTYIVEDDVLNGWSGTSTVGDEFSSTAVAMSLEYITLTWNSQPGLFYDIYKATTLPNFTKLFPGDPKFATDYTTSRQVPIGEGETRAFYKIQTLTNP